MTARISFIRERGNFTKVVIERAGNTQATNPQLNALHALTVEEWVNFAHPRNTDRPTLGFINSPTLTQLWTTRDRERHVRAEIERIEAAQRPRQRRRNR